MKIFITGNLGFIGTHLSTILLKEGYTIIGYDKQKPSTKQKYECIQGNILDCELLRKTITSDIDCVIHLAAEHKDNIKPESLYHDINITGTKNIINACENNDVNNIIFTSTVAVYGFNAASTNENSKLNPFNDYGKSKIKAEKHLSTWAKKDINRSLTIIRLTTVFGEGNRGNIYNLINQINKDIFIMVGNGNNKKSIAYVGNLVNFFILLLGSKPGRYIYNYADKPDLKIHELITMINVILKKKTRTFKIPFWLGICFGYACDMISFLFRKEFLFSSIRMKKFCVNTMISTKKLENLNLTIDHTINEALKRTIKYDFMKK